VGERQSQALEFQGPVRHARQKQGCDRLASRKSTSSEYTFTVVSDENLAKSPLRTTRVGGGNFCHPSKHQISLEIQHQFVLHFSQFPQGSQKSRSKQSVKEEPWPQP